MSNYACDGQSIPFDAFLRQMLNDPTVAELTDFVASYVKNNTISQTDGFKGDSMKHETEMGGNVERSPAPTEYWRQRSVHLLWRRAIWSASCGIPCIGLVTIYCFHLLLRHLDVKM
ncbi:hypothetical protein [Paenibacillus sp. FSL L8-0708]|uniref:hypothetical protein n=1 Tax=Paenibacillus sp. FSL L8-0708 TaxID=2975311 RepID=UPI0030F5551A